MEYTVQKLGKLAGVSTRTLRYYDEIGILKHQELIHQVIEFMGLKKLTSCNKYYSIEN